MREWGKRGGWGKGCIERSWSERCRRGGRGVWGGWEGEG